MTTTYITTERTPQVQTSFINTGPGAPQLQTTIVTTGPGAPPVQTTFVTTGPAKVPQTAYVEVVEDPSVQFTYSRWGGKNNAHTATLGILLFTYAGMDMAQGLGWNLNTGVTTTYEFNYSWFIGMIIGAVVSAVAVNWIPKKFIYILGGVMQLIDAIIFVSAPYKYSPILAARWVGGVGMGLITVIYIIQNSEVALCGSRGFWCGLEQFGLTLGIMIQVLMDSQWNFGSPITINTAHGIIGIIFSVFATASVAMSVESPIFYLSRGNENEARTCQTQLLGTGAPREVFNAVFNEAKLYVEDGNNQSIGSQITSSIMPFIKHLFCRCMVAFSFSLPLSTSMLTSTIVWKSTIYSWPMILWSILRLIGMLAALSVVDKLGRKFVMLLGLICMAGLMLAMGGIYSDDSYMESDYYMEQISRVAMTFQCFAGMFVVSTPTYLGEAFPMRVKPYLIGLIICLEQVIHIIVIATFGKTTDCFFQYFIGVGIILVASLIFLAAVMPETRGLTLREACDRFRRRHDYMSY